LKFVLDFAPNVPKVNQIFTSAYNPITVVVQSSCQWFVRIVGNFYSCPCPSVSGIT